MISEQKLIELEENERSAIDEELVAILLLLETCHNDITSAIRIFYQKYGDNNRVTYAEARKWVSDKDHTRRLTALIAAVTGYLDSAFTQILVHFKSMLTEIIELEADGFNVDVPIDSVLETVWGVDESLWEDRLLAHRDKWKNVLSNDIKQSILKQADVNAVLEEIQKRNLSMKTILRRLGYTEGTAIGSLARRRIFKELGVTKYKFYTREDERTCEVCGALHGLVFPISSYEIGVNASPIHPWCRCWEVPIID